MIGSRPTVEPPAPRARVNQARLSTSPCLSRAPNASALACPAFATKLHLHLKGKYLTVHMHLVHVGGLACLLECRLARPACLHSEPPAASWPSCEWRRFRVRNLPGLVSWAAVQALLRGSACWLPRQRQPQLRRIFTSKKPLRRPRLGAVGARGARIHDGPAGPVDAVKRCRPKCRAMRPGFAANGGRTRSSCDASFAFRTMWHSGRDSKSQTGPEPNCALAPAADRRPRRVGAPDPCHHAIVCRLVTLMLCAYAVRAPRLLLHSGR